METSKKSTKPRRPWIPKEDFLKGKRKTHPKTESKEATWITRRELDPDCSYFPLSSESKVLIGARSELYLFTIELAFDQACTTDGSGNLATVISNTPVQASNWANYAAVFDEYRILSTRATFVPATFTGGASLITRCPIASVIDRSDSTALTGYTLAERYSSHKKTRGGGKFSQHWAMASVDESAFVQTSAPAANGWFKVYSSGNTASLTIGRYEVVLILQFRGLGIN